MNSTTNIQTKTPRPVRCSARLGRRTLENSENWRVWTRGIRLLVAHKHSKAKAACTWRLPGRSLSKDEARLPRLIEILRDDVIGIVEAAGRPIGRPRQQVVRAQCQANVKRDDELDVCGKPATEAVVEHGDYVPVCAHHAMIARRNHWAVGCLRPNEKGQR